MTRNSQLPDYHTHRHLWTLFRQSSLVTGPFSFLNPTRAHFHHFKQNDHEQLADDVQFQWRSRDNRKGRHALLVVKPAVSQGTAHFIAPESTSSFREIMKGVARMFTQYPYYDVSWLVAVIFTLGSVVWCINGFLSFLPLVRPSSEFATETVYGGGITAFIGATLFEIGSILLMVEAVNENRTGCFGWAVEMVIAGEKGGLLRVRSGGCMHHHRNKMNLVGKGVIDDASKDSDDANATFSNNNEEIRELDNWVWFPSWDDLTSHYFREIGFLACLSQTIGATIFWISGFTALPKVINMSNTDLTDGAYWAPQVVGGMGFVICSLLFMLETQRTWYLPAWGTLGWHIGLWNLIGALGFTVFFFFLQYLRGPETDFASTALWCFWLLVELRSTVPSSVLYVLGQLGVLDSQRHSVVREFG